MMHAEVSEELRRRGVISSANNPIGNLAEHLFCRASSWKQAPSSKRDADATDAAEMRYLIKGRRLMPHNNSRQLGRCAICRPKALMCSLRFYFRRIVEFSGRRAEAAWALALSEDPTAM
jgi:hypothetical protein